MYREEFYGTSFHGRKAWIECLITIGFSAVMLLLGWLCTSIYTDDILDNTIRIQQGLLPKAADLSTGEAGLGSLGFILFGLLLLCFAIKGAIIAARGKRTMLNFVIDERKFVICYGPDNEREYPNVWRLGRRKSVKWKDIISFARVGDTDTYNLMFSRNPASNKKAPRVCSFGGSLKLPNGETIAERLAAELAVRAPAAAVTLSPA